MTLPDLLTRINAHIEAGVERSVQRHPVLWIVATSLLIVAVALLAKGALG